MIRKLAAAVAIAACISTVIIAAQQPVTVRVPRAVLEKYVGVYVYPDGSSFTVALDGDTLIQEIPGRRLAYAPISETIFMLGPVFTAEFVFDEAGGATQILSDGVGIEYRLRRKGSPPSPPKPRDSGAGAVNVPKSVLQRYVGVYEFIPGQMSRTDLRITIRLEGDSLTREGTGPKAVLVPISETRFRVRDSSFVVEFVVDDAGVTQVLGTGFQQMLARLTSKR
jgi:hypothetical protein